MLRKIRVVMAVCCFTFLTLLFLDFTGLLHHWLGWVTKAQLVPALLSVNLVVVGVLVALTLLFGRIYCSVLCPLGVLQDVVSWFARKWRKRRFTYSKPLNWLRYLFLALFVVSFFAGLNTVVALLEPYGAYGRISANLFAPIYRWGNNLLSVMAERADSYAFYSVDVWMKSAVTLSVSIATLLVVGMLAWRNGRSYCNTVCPVGTVLGALSKYALLKPVLNTNLCNGCKSCARNCKASCIDTQTHNIDYSRCVSCMDCLDSCKQGAITYSRKSRKHQNKAMEPVHVAAYGTAKTPGRRSFLAIAALFAFTRATKAQQQATEGGLAILVDKKIPQRTTPVVPPGAQGMKHFAQRCTACGLCISGCPNNLLRPSGSLLTLMQPQMGFERGYCRPECTACGDVCPTGAIVPVTKAHKSALQIGYAVWVKENCVVKTDDVDCDNCARHCPTNAIEMVPGDPDNDSARKIPAVNTERCTGCGACEYLCPARPFSAIYVEGVERHRTV